MSEITLEKVEQIKERTGVSYKIAKEALEMSSGDVLEALIYLENQKEAEKKDKFNIDLEGKYETVEDVKNWLMDLIKKGNVSRIRVKKDQKILVDVPVNAGIAAGVIAIIMPPILAIGLITAIATDLTFEITKKDGSVEVVNKIIKETANDVKEKTTGFADTIKSKISNIKDEVIPKDKTNNKSELDETVYSYTVKFDEDKDKKDNQNKNDENKENENDESKENAKNDK